MKYLGPLFLIGIYATVTVGIIATIAGGVAVYQQRNVDEYNPEMLHNCQNVDEWIAPDNERLATVTTFNADETTNAALPRVIDIE